MGCYWLRLAAPHPAHPFRRLSGNVPLDIAVIELALHEAGADRASAGFREG